MGLTLTQSALYSKNDLVQGTMATIILRDTLSAVMPARTTKSSVLEVNVESTEHDAAAVDINGDVPETMGDDEKKSFRLGRIAGQNPIDQYQRIAESSTQSIGELQLTKLAKKIRKAWSGYIITGTGANLQPYGLVTYATAESRVETVSSAFDLDLLDYAVDEVIDYSDGEPFVAVNKTVAGKIRSLMRLMPGNTVENIEMGFIDPTTGERGQRKVLAFQGTPVHINNTLSDSQILSGVLSETDGVTAIVHENLADMVLPELGISHPTKPYKIDRLTMMAGIAVLNPKAIKVVSGFTL